MAGCHLACCICCCASASPLVPAPLCPAADDPKVARELQFFERVKQRLRNKEAYADFLKCECGAGAHLVGRL